MCIYLRGLYYGGVIIIKYKLISKKCFKFLFLLLFIISSNSIVYADGKYKRYGGQDRYETAIKISQNFNSKSGYAILVSGENFPDALCSSPLSKKYDAPIILTTEKKLDDRAVQQLKEFSISKVFIIGQAISKDVESSLSDMGINSERIGGKDRYETAILIANYVGIKDRIFVVSGDGYPDALSVAPIAATIDIPIILVTKDSVPDIVKDFLKEKDVTYTYVIGSEGVISENVKSQFKNAERISGKDRYSTNMEIISRFIDVLDMNNVYLASALNFPDSLSGAALAQKNRAPLILVSESISKDTQDTIKQTLASAKNVYVLGSEGAVSVQTLYLVGLESKPPEPPKREGPQPPPWTNSFGVMDAPETTRVYVRKEANSYSAVVGSTYGSLVEVKVLDRKDDYYYVEILDYDSSSYVRGYIPVSKVKTVTPTAPYNILVDKSKQRVYVFSGDKMVKEIICSTGKDGTSTPSGRFLIGSKGQFFYASESSICYFWTRIDNNYLFHSVIYDLSGDPIKSEYDKLGSKASHGCIRLPYDDAKWLQDTIPYGTLVTITD